VIAFFQELLKQDPDDTEAMMGRAYLLGFWSEALTGEASTAKLRQAEQSWQQLLELRPRSSVIQRALRWVQKRLDQPASAASPPPPTQLLVEGLQKQEKADDSEESAATPLLQASDLRQLRASAGSIVRVHGRVLSVNTRVGKTGLSFIRFGTNRGQFSGVIPANVLTIFQSAYGEDLGDLVGEDIALYDLLSFHNQTPQIILTRSDQIITAHDE
jgi:hypothetical protein